MEKRYSNLGSIHRIGVFPIQMQYILLVFSLLLILLTPYFSSISWYGIAFTFVPVLLFADFLSGILHFYFDHVAEPNQETYIGKVAQDFHIHHKYPNSSVNISWLESSHLSCPFVTLAVL